MEKNSNSKQNKNTKILQKKYLFNKSEFKEGGFGKVYFGTDLSNNRNCAIKFESDIRKEKCLKHEFEVYKQIRQNSLDVNRFPQIYDFIEEEDIGNYLVMELLGDNLEELFKLCGQKFSVKTTAILAKQVIDLIQIVHVAGYVYRDIAPDNFVLGQDKNSDQLYLIDFGMAKKFHDGSGKQLKWKEGYALRGRDLFASTWDHWGVELAPRDDLLSIGYMIFRFIKGSLPWENQFTSNDQFFLLKTFQMKLVEEQIEKKLLFMDAPEEFIAYMQYCYNLNYSENIDYDYLKSLFQKVLQKSNSNDDDHDFEWKPNKK